MDLRELIDRAVARLGTMTPERRFVVGNIVLVVGAALVGLAAGGLGPFVAAATVATGNYALRAAFSDLR